MIGIEENRSKTKPALDLNHRVRSLPERGRVAQKEKVHAQDQRDSPVALRAPARPAADCSGSQRQSEHGARLFGARHGGGIEVAAGGRVGRTASGSGAISPECGNQNASPAPAAGFPARPPTTGAASRSDQGTAVGGISRTAPGRLLLFAFLQAISALEETTGRGAASGASPRREAVRRLGGCHDSDSSCRWQRHAGAAVRQRAGFPVTPMPKPRRTSRWRTG